MRCIRKPSTGCSQGSTASPDGAFYIYARLPDGWPDSTVVAHRWLQETGVAVTPGIDFDTVEGGRYLRFGYAGATEDIAEAVSRLERWQL